MPLEVIENITRVEADNRERKASAEAKAKQIVADAQRDGLALLQQTRAAAADRGRELLRQAETRAEAKGDEISRAAQAEGETLRREAESHGQAAHKVKNARPLPPELKELEGRVRETLGMRATLSGNAKKGKIVLQYYSQEELERLYEVLEKLDTL